jgi:hypothetical protein
MSVYHTYVSFGASPLHSPESEPDVSEEHLHVRITSSASYVIHLLLILFYDPEKEAKYSAETSVTLQYTTGHYIPEDKTLHSYNYKNLNIL